MIDKLHYISQQRKSVTHLADVENALEAGCKWIQLRIKDEPEEQILNHARHAKELCDQYKAKLIINDHPDIALAVEAYGLHLGLEDMPVAEARKIVGNSMIIGGTANTIEHIMQRVAEGVDYIGLGPYRFTATKKKLSPIVGIEGYTAIMHQMKEAGMNTPVIAIGGIELNDISAIIETGIYGVAVSGAIAQANDRALVVKQMYEALSADYQVKY